MIGSWACSRRGPPDRRGRRDGGDRGARRRPCSGARYSTTWCGATARCASRRGRSGRSATSTRSATHTITFGIGPAGTGKTFLAVALAAAALSRKEVNRIILTRPAVEAGERLGFLPGDLMAKVDPYLRPLFDALHDMIDPEKVSQHLERGVIEVAPLAFMRGRTLNDSFVILDEAQNTTPEQMKMFLTRLGFGSRMVVTGDITQVDLPASSGPGLSSSPTSSARSRASRSCAWAARTSCATGWCSGSSRPTRSTPSAARPRSRPPKQARSLDARVRIVGARRSRDARRSSASRRSARAGPAMGTWRSSSSTPRGSRAQPRAPRRRRRRPTCSSFPIDGAAADRRPARARRRRDLPGAHASSCARPSCTAPAPARHGPRARLGRDARTPARAAELVTRAGFVGARRAAERGQVDAGERDRRRARWRSSPTAPRRRGAPSAASRPVPTGSSSWWTCRACSARATRSPSACPPCHAELADADAR